MKLIYLPINNAKLANVFKLKNATSWVDIKGVNETCASTKRCGNGGKLLLVGWVL